jgi:hypothetical protein
VEKKQPDGADKNMGEEHDSWLGGIGVSLSGFLDTVAAEGKSMVASLASAGSGMLQEAGKLMDGASKDPGSALNSTGSADESTPNQTDAGKADAGGPEAPAFNHSEGTNKILADSPSEFVIKANAAMGGTGTAGHLEIDPITWNPDTDQRGRVTRVNMAEVKSRIVRPVWAGGRPIGNEADVIKKAEQLIQAHEQRHRAILVDFTTRAVAAARGQPGDQAMKTLDKFMADMDAAQVALDASEGKINIVSGGGRELDVTLGPL